MREEKLPCLQSIKTLIHLWGHAVSSLLSSTPASSRIPTNHVPKPGIPSLQANRRLRPTPMQEAPGTPGEFEKVEARGFHGARSKDPVERLHDIAPNTPVSSDPSLAKLRAGLSWAKLGVLMNVTLSFHHSPESPRRRMLCTSRLHEPKAAGPTSRKSPVAGLQGSACLQAHKQERGSPPNYWVNLE